jgi:two-component system sensor histidine kinase UhpB
LNLRTRLHALFALTLLAVLSVGTGLIVHDARRSVREEVSSSLRLAERLLETSLSGADEEAGMKNLVRQLAELGRMRHLRLLAYPAPSEVSTVPEAREKPAGKAGFHGLAAHEGEWQDAASEKPAAPAFFVWLTEPEPRRVEKWLGKPGESPGIIIESQPQDEIAEVWRESRSFLGLLLLAFLCVYALVHVILGRAFRHIDTILAALRRVENGDYAQRLPEFPQPEFRQIARAFNHAAEALQKARADNLALAGHSLRAQEEERRAIARELHDELGQSLSAIKALSAAIRARESAPETCEAATAISSLCDQLFGIVRGLMRRLRPAMIDELGLRAALEDLLQSWRGLHPQTQVELEFADAVEAAKGESKIQIFRIVQECLTNSVRHAGAGRVSVTLSINPPGWVTLRVQDDGRGFDASHPPEGFGISGMRERVSCLGGQFTLTSAPNQGVCVEARIPLQSGAAEVEG